MKQRVIFASLALAAAVAAIIIIAAPWSGKRIEAPREQAAEAVPEKAVQPVQKSVSVTDSNRATVPVRERAPTPQAPQQIAEIGSTNKLERLNQIREQFRTLAA